MRSTPARADTQRIALVGLLAALAVALGWVESAAGLALPFPGVRLGFANIPVIVALVALGPRSAGSVALAKVLLTGLATGGLLGPAGAMSAVGTALAWLAAVALAAAGERFSPVGLGIGAAVAHVCGQYAVACALAGSTAPLSLLAPSLVLSLLAGLVTGYSARILLTRVPLAASVRA